MPPAASRLPDARSSGNDSAMAKWHLWKSLPRVVLGPQSPSIDLLWLPIHMEYDITRRITIGKLQTDHIKVKCPVNASVL